MAVILIIMGTLMIVINLNSFRKGKKGFKDTLKVKEENMVDYDVELFKMRQDFAETILEFQMDIQMLNRKIDEIAKTDKVEKRAPSVEKVNDNLLKNTNKSVKVVEVDKLLKDGMSIENVAEKLSISKGEALLIKELYIK